tara:strand:+ start:353 stop:559 length:207 start_codon:yes stop_codon:yes gene_type:complete
MDTLLITNILLIAILVVLIIICLIGMAFIMNSLMWISEKLDTSNHHLEEIKSKTDDIKGTVRDLSLRE